MSVTFHSHRRKRLTFGSHNGFGQWLMHHRVFMAAGYFELPGGTHWIPDDAKDAAQIIVPKSCIFAAEAACRTLRDAIQAGVKNDRPWVTQRDRDYVQTLDGFIEFLGQSGGFST